MTFDHEEVPHNVAEEVKEKFLVVIYEGVIKMAKENLIEANLTVT